jgi:protein-S-isoprenylcysteine O-methyltransferase Ste14
LKEKIINIIYESASGSNSLFVFFTGFSFTLFTSLFVVIPVTIENIIDISYPAIYLKYPVSVLLFGMGSSLMLWTNVIFMKDKGTPVHLKPPPVLIIKGPFRYIRNPMHAGLFLLLISIGLFFGSFLTLLVFIPLYIIIDIWFIKNIEEPELEKRFGEEYLKYKSSTPRFIPKFK